MTDLVSIAVGGLVLGSLYALMASGLSLIWSTLRVFNFAHGALLTVGAYMAWTVADVAGGGVVVAALGALIVMVPLAFLVHVLLVRPFIARPQGDLLVMVATLAGAGLLVSGVQLVWGPELKRLPTISEGAVKVAGTAVGATQLTAIVVAPVILVGLGLLLNRTRLGLAIRATEQNREFAQLLGVSPEKVYLITIVLAVALATVAGVLLGGLRFVTPAMGADPLLKAFVVVVFGGLARLSGTVAGAYVIGFLEAAGNFWLGLSWTPVVVFAVMVGVLLVRPEGLIAHKRAHR